MDDDAEHRFAGFVAAEQPALLRLAFLLTGDRRAADRLVRRALLRTHRSWQRGTRRDAPADVARHTLVRTVASRLPTRWSRPGRLGPGSDEVLRALLALPGHLRAAVVLRCSEGLHDAEAASVMGVPDATARRWTAAGLTRLAAEIAVPSPLESAEQQLRRRLRALADAAGPPGDGASLGWWLVRDAAVHRRVRRAVAVAVAAVAVVTAVPVALGASATEGGPRAAGGSAPDRGPVAGTGGITTRQDVFDRPTRGSLAADEAFLEALRAVPWLDPATASPDAVDSPVDGRHVVFAGDVPSGRWAFLVGRPVVIPAQPWGGGSTHGTMAAVWLTGPSGASADQMRPATEPTTLEAGWPSALLDPDAGLLVVVAAQDDVVEVSERPEIAADGSISREFRPVRTDEGIAVVRLTERGLPFGGALAFRARNGGPDGEPMSSWSMTVLDGTWGEVAIDYPRGTPDATGRQAAEYAAERVLREVGLPREDVEVAAQWVGSVPAEGSGQAAVVTVTVPSGAVILESHWLLPAPGDGPVQGADCGRAVLPAGPRRSGACWP
ncbi:hypothetical protein [Blastococcus sp. PRF04-17]|uniref:hypothetical protein n=1 Tax=Blastococcus sp. PRF04-17 TaxID=2933797 RepID=UPI001FF6E6DF|nr:hypothetical protein [Blastococcus sp. PRF04-17]UOY02056.1 hypothetical protein MVA48_01325 [Blastococcus sp. PRF04-17]